MEDAPLDEVPTGEDGQVQPELPPLEDGASATASQPESMLSHIHAKTPPNVAAAYRLIEEGRRLLGQGDPIQALGRFERSVAVDPTNAYGYYFLALLHRDAQELSQAIAFAGRAAALAARSDPLCEARSYTLQGMVYEQVGRFADARNAYRKALQRDPRNGEARLGLGRLSPQ